MSSRWSDFSDTDRGGDAIYSKRRSSRAYFTRSEEMVNGKPVVEWVGGNTTAVQHQYTYWDKTKIKGETK